MIGATCIDCSADISEFRKGTKRCRPCGQVARHRPTFGTCRLDLPDCAPSKRLIGDLCARHYDRLHRTGSTDLADVPRGLDRYEVDANGCWLWMGSLNVSGYGTVDADRYGTVVAHRVTYERVHGPIPDGMQIDHLCRVRRCINPDHLEAVTPSVNLARGLHGYALRTHCKSGLHDITAPASWWVDGKGRTCLECHKAAQERGQIRYRARRKQARAA